MTPQEIADRLYELCQIADYDTAHSELFAENATSTEPNRTGTLQTVTGMEAINEKMKQFNKSVVEMHDSFVGDPYVFGNYIFMEFNMDLTMKDAPRMEMNEMAVYEVKDGKIISQRFYY